VLTDLNPWVVSFHLLVSLAMIGLAVLYLFRLDEPSAPAVRPSPAVWLAARRSA
jgi:cytochrome c oxidase assembly protein subunit 15